jgi:dephospho-CoA kinase
MLELKKVAVTGNLYSGKSTVCQLLQKQGAFVLNADLIVHHLLLKPHVIQSVIEIFGREILDDQEKIDRKKLSSLAFKNNELLKKLEELLHPLVLEEIQKTYYEKSSSLHKESLFVVEVPLLFEAGWQNWFDFTILVKAEMDTRRKRFLNQGYENNDFTLRSSRQMDPKIAEKQSHAIIVNDSDLSYLETQVKTILNKLNHQKP